MKTARNLTIVSLLVAALMAAVTNFTPATAQQPPSEPPGLGDADDAIPDPDNDGTAIARLALEAAKLRFLEAQGVVGVGLGLTDNGTPAIKIFVIDVGVGGIPTNVRGVPVVVQVTGELVAQGHKKTIYSRPVPIGTSSGPERLISAQGSLFCTTGTLACRVKKDGKVFAMSNAHVYALEGSNPDGGPVVVGQDRVLQPGRVDAFQVCALVDDDVIGTLFDFKEIVFSRRANNTIDAAIALSNTDLLGTSTPVGLGYGTPSATIVAAQLDMPVQKLGRTTDLTKGKVTAINASVIIRYDAGQARFVNQIMIEGTNVSFSAGGDSGSLIVTDDGNNNPVALLFAGSSSITIGNPIGLVLAEFGVTIDGTAPSVCGDGAVEAGEQCDDGGTVDCDGCSSTCTLEGVCGDGVLDAACEECDDNNTVSGDGCSSVCTIEPFCGDGTVNVGEECDDGNNTDCDGCSASCTDEGFCGDGTLDPICEQCDDGNNTDCDGCSASCTDEGFCGDGCLDAPEEECDDGNNVDGDGCAADCTVELCTPKGDACNTNSDCCSNKCKNGSCKGN